MAHKIITSAQIPRNGQRAAYLSAKYKNVNLGNLTQNTKKYFYFHLDILFSFPLTLK